MIDRKADDAPLAPRPTPRSEIYRHLNDRQLTELIATYLFNLTRGVDHLTRRLADIAADVDSIEDAAGSLADVVDNLKIPGTFLKKRT